MEIRPYQQQAIDDIATAAHAGHRRILVQASTGSGKTIIASQIVKHAIQTGKKVLFLIHRRELAWQTQRKIRDLGLEAGILMGDEPHDPTLPLQIASIQTLHRRAIKRAAMSLPPADLVIVDECHSATAKSWNDILAMYGDAFILGLSATPIRQTGRGLGHSFDTMVLGPTIKELTDQGWLVPARYFTGSMADLKGLKIQNGDYQDGQLEKRMDQIKLIGDIVENFTRICPERKAIVFASGVKHSIHIAEQFNAVGIAAKHIDGNTPIPDRDAVIEEFTNGNLQVISNVGVYCEGTDIPIASCLIFARPTKSVRLFLQVAGRVLRPAAGKRDCIILDHAGVVHEFGQIDQEWEWKLDYAEDTAGNLAAKKRDKKKEITCKKCGCCYRGMLDCPECHTRPEINGKAVETFEAYLQELTALEVPKEIQHPKSVWWSAFKFEALKKTDWKRASDGLPARAYGLYKEKFKVWPSGFDKRAPAVEGTKDILAWIQHSKIKYIKSMEAKRKPYGQSYWNWKADARSNAYTPEAG